MNALTLDYMRAADEVYRLIQTPAAERDQVAYDAAVERFSRLGREVLARQTRSKRIFSARMPCKR
jgi:hypothetical protein